MANGYRQVIHRPLKIVIFASGAGSNAEVLGRWAIDNPSRAIVAGLLTDNPQAGVIDKATTINIPVKVVPRVDPHGGSGVGSDLGPRISRKVHEKRILEAIAEWHPEWIFLAGYMRILSADFLARFRCETTGRFRVVNIHPSILPEFPGMDAYRRAFDAGVSHSGVTVHQVDEGVDTGPVLAQEPFPRYPDDDFRTFQMRGQAVEHRLYAEVLAHIADSGGG